MVIGNLTRTEESAIHGEWNGKPGTGDPGRWWWRDAQMLRVPLPGLPLASESGGRGQEESGPLMEVLTQLNCRIIFSPQRIQNHFKYSLSLWPRSWGKIAFTCFRFPKINTRINKIQSWHLGFLFENEWLCLWRTLRNQRKTSHYLFTLWSCVVSFVFVPHMK